MNSFQKVLNKFYSLSKNTQVAIISLIGLTLITGVTYQLSQQTSILNSLANESNKPEFVKDEVLVKFKSDSPAANREEALNAVQGRIDHTIEQIEVHVIKVPENSVEKVIEALSRNPNIEFAEPNYIGQEQEIPNDPLYPNQKPMHKIGADKAWDVTHGSESTRIAVLDSGVDLDHPDLVSKLILSRDFTGENNTGQDTTGHGTKQAGTVGAATNNAMGVTGLGYSAKIMNGKVCNSSGCPWSSVASAITWASDNGARVINMSIGGLGGGSTLESAVNYAWNNNVVLVASAGNCGSGCTINNVSYTNPIYYPAAYSNVIAVAATSLSDVKVSYSEYGSWVDVASPTDDTTTTNGGGYGGAGGTSNASPHVAGLAGLIAGQHPEWSNKQIRDQIEQTSDKIAGTGTYWAHGRINACRAVGNTGDCGTVTNPPTPTPTNSPTPTPTLVPGGDTIFNGSFETNNNGIPANWSGGAWDNTVSRTGTASLRITGPANGIYSWQKPPLKPSTTYTVQGWVKTQGIPTADQGGSLRYVNVPGNIEQTGAVDGTNDWTLVQRVFTTPADWTTSSRLDLFAWFTTGTVWYDDVQLCEGSCPIDNTPTNTPAPTSPFSTPTSIPPTNTPVPTSLPADTTKPTVNISSPLNGASVTVKTNVNIQANATDNVGIDRVVFTVGGNTSTDYTAPYSYNWSIPGAANKSYVVSATAYDARGNSSVSQVTVRLVR